MATCERILFVTGRLAEYSLRNVLAELSPAAGFDYDVRVLGISVAALMYADWVARHLQVEPGFDRVVLPGWCRGNLDPLKKQFGLSIERGPKDLLDLPEYFGQGEYRSSVELTEYDIEILAEINHAPCQLESDILRAADSYRRSGADVIDLGCDPDERWKQAGTVTRLLRDEGFRVSIDSFRRTEVEAAVENGAELVLSCNSSNVEWASQLGVELVVIPDEPERFETLEQTIEILNEAAVTFRIDPILEPIGFGFAASLGRYIDVRRRWPDANILMGIGNVTELTETDTAGINVLLAGFCQELGMHSVLTTEVANWARSAVREFDLARRLMHYSVKNHMLPEHLDSRLVMLRDSARKQLGQDALDRLANQLKDSNFRVFVEGDTIHVLNGFGHWCGTEPQEMFEQLVKDTDRPIDSAHAFYLGCELSRAATALVLGKQYTQDEPLRWGFLTPEEENTIQITLPSGDTLS